MIAWQDGRSTFVDLGWSRCHLLEWGERGAPVVLLQHGLLDHAASWSWIAGHLQNRYHVVAPDLRGHGESDWSPNRDYSLSGYVLDTFAVAEALDLRDINLVGHSLGGHVVLRIAAAFPDRTRSIVSIEGLELPLVRQQRREPKSHAARLRDWVTKELQASQRPRRFYPDLDSATQRMADAFSKMDNDTVERLSRAGIIRQAGRGFRWKYDQACRLRPPEDQHGRDLDDVLTAITCPVLLAYGDDSWIEHPPADRLALLQQYRVVRFPGASHWLHHQSRPEFCRLLDEFLLAPANIIEFERTHNA